MALPPNSKLQMQGSFTGSTSQVNTLCSVHSKNNINEAPAFAASPWMNVHRLRCPVGIAEESWRASVLVRIQQETLILVALQLDKWAHIHTRKITMRYPSSFLISLFFILSTLESVVGLTSEEFTVLKNLSSQFKFWDASNPADACNWQGVICNGTDHVLQLSLQNQNLEGNIPSPICQLKHLQRLDLSNNLFSGTLANLSTCHTLVYLNLSYNSLLGDLSSLSPLQNLHILDLSRNSFGGVLAQQVKNLTNLRTLNLSYNSFTGLVPPSLGKLSYLEEVHLSHNSLDGPIPTGLEGGLGLRFVDLSQNKLNGKIPDIFVNLPKLTHLILSQNNLNGGIPRLPNLTYFSANLNQLRGIIPAELGSIRALERLDLSYNQLTGSIPENLFTSCSLRTLDLTNNQLEGTIPENVYQCKDLFRLRVGSNRLKGNISSKIGHLSQLTSFEADSNSLEGELPQDLERCHNLTLLNLAKNKLTGQIPAQLGSLQSLQKLNLSENFLSGQFPEALSKCSQLGYLDLSSNRLSGNISENAFKQQPLQVLRLQNNNFSGRIPQNIGDYISLLELQLGNNEFSGKIPSEIGKYINLQIALNLSHNFLNGSIPAELSKLSKLVVLDLSNNKLTGHIPKMLEFMQSLAEFDVSNNQLTGVLPNFNKATTVNTSGTKISTHNNSPGTNTNSRKHTRNVSGVLIGIAGGVIAVIAFGLTLVAWKYFQHDREMLEDDDSSMIVGHLLDPDSVHRESIDFEKALKATQEPANLVLKNKFSTYYKAVMPSGTAYSVKKLNWMDKIFKPGSHQKLEGELEKHGKLSHPNIMTPLAYVLKTDWALLLYEYVHKGNLAEFLHSSNVSALDWPSRYKIAIGVARGLSYLHGCYPPIMHLDLTSKNILLKSLTEPQIGDVELCKIVDPSKTIGSLSTVAGSVGYIPPEYAYTMRVTMASNVYSFGVILLELLTGRPPISKGMDLARWVQRTPSRDETWEQMLDSRISNSSFKTRNEMISVLRIALGCISSSPESRPKIRTVVGMLQIARQT